LDLRLLVEHGRLGRLEIGLGLIDLGQEDVRVDPRNDLVLLHDRVEVDQEILDLTGHLTTDLHRDDGVEIAHSRDGRGKGAALNPDQAVFRHAATALNVEITPDRATDQYGDDDERNDSLHQLLRRYRGRTVSSKSAATDGTIQPREGDPVI